jgi:hypothetical protein
MTVHYREKCLHIPNLNVLNNLSYLHVTTPNIVLLALKKEIRIIKTKAR